MKLSVPLPRGYPSYCGFPNCGIKVQPALKGRVDTSPVRRGGALPCNASTRRDGLRFVAIKRRTQNSAASCREQRRNSREVRPEAILIQLRLCYSERKKEPLRSAVGFRDHHPG